MLAIYIPHHVTGIWDKLWTLKSSELKSAMLLQDSCDKYSREAKGKVGHDPSSRRPITQAILKAFGYQYPGLQMVDTYGYSIQNLPIHWVSSQSPLRRVCQRWQLATSWWFEDYLIRSLTILSSVLPSCSLFPDFAYWVFEPCWIVVPSSDIATYMALNEVSD